MNDERMQNFRLVLQYEGTRYHGWQVQPKMSTIQGELEVAFETITGQRVRVVGAGRTDAGVHALGQTAHARLDNDMSAIQIQRALNGVLPRDIRVVEVSGTRPDFHAQYDARSKIYFYQIVTAEVLSPFLRPYALHHRGPLDLERMRRAGETMVGKHDFSPFCSSDSEVKNKVRTVLMCDIHQRDDRLVFAVEADGFLKYMVRSMMGTLIDVGVGRKSLREVEQLLETGRRDDAGPTMPARGLFLLRVKY